MVKVNGMELDIAGKTIAEYLANTNYDSKRIAVERNGRNGYPQHHSDQKNKRFYLCGDAVSDVKKTMGLFASRVMICAAHQAHTALRILAGEFEV